MLKNKFVIFNIPFNNMKKNPNRLTKEWITSRMNIFFQFTFESLKIQTNQNFEAYINCDGESMDTIYEVLQGREDLPSNIHFIDFRQFTACIRQATKDYENFYLVRIDSDNMYHKEFVQKLYDIQPKPETEALLCQYGYLLDVQANQLAYNFHPSPAYYAFIYKTKEYQSTKKYVLTSHKKIVTDFKVELLNDYYYLTTITGVNELFAPRHMIGKELVEEEKKMQVFQDFGLPRDFDGRKDAYVSK